MLLPFFHFFFPTCSSSFSAPFRLAAAVVDVVAFKRYGFVWFRMSGIDHDFCWLQTDLLVAMPSDKGYSGIE
jgi:hypothetical protein